MGRILETELYPPVKAFLIGQGYDVKAEVGGRRPSRLPRRRRPGDRRIEKPGSP
ncbi:hypothetical protein QW131_33690 [Roseibium salinum]|nr:hypothetical protein [Roseibium salinum]